jgi:anti-sigma factor RsiW
MTYADEGILRAWLDGELDDADARQIEDRMNEDPETRGMLERMRSREARVRGLLATLDVDGEAPAERVRAVLRAIRRSSMTRPVVPTGERPRPSLPGSGRKRASARWTRESPLAKAAVLVLLFAGAAGAAIVPGSPVRSWLTATLGLEPDRAARPAAAIEAPEPESVGGLSGAPGTNRFEIDLEAVPDGAEIEVTTVPGDTAAIYAPAGSEYEWDADVGRARAEVAGGPIRLELPVSMDVDLIVNGRVYLSRRGDRTDLRVAPIYRSPTEIRFHVGPDPGNSR